MHEHSDPPHGAAGKPEPDDLEGTLILAAPEPVADATAVDEREATLFMTPRERVAQPDATLVLGNDVSKVSAMAVDATMLLPVAAPAHDHAKETLMATMAVSAPAAAYRTPITAPQGHPPGQLAAFPPAAFPAPGGPPPGAPQGSRLGLVLAILALIAAVAGVAVGLLLGDG